MSLDTSNAALAERYDAIPYAAVPHPLTTPDRLATVAAFLGLEPAPVAQARVLEVGCSDGANLIPMAAALPGAHFVGCDLSARAIAAGQRTIDALALSNVTLVHGDLGALSPSLGSFDYLVAHGVYSWVPPPVRDALFALAQDRLAPKGVMFVSYNALPGARVRQAAWDVLHYGTDGIADPRERLAAARRLARAVADGARSLYDGDDALRTAFRAIAQKSDSELCHDDLAVPNDPVWFHAFVAHARRFGLDYLADADLHTMSAAGIEPDARAYLGTLDPLAREQHLDFVRLRRFRQSLLCRADALQGRDLKPQRLLRMHVAADPSLLRAAEAGKVAELARGLDPAGAGGGPVRMLLDALVESAPASTPVAALLAPALPRPLEAILTDAFVANIIVLHMQPPSVVAAAGALPSASALARHQAGTQEQVTNQLHVRVRLPDRNARALLARLDGATDRSALARAMADAGNGLDAVQAPRFVDHALAQLARLALLVG
ncbi:MAG: class I SAM-dependent methyltransferase [Betaproteobacteria bacterium]